ncbi:hypothetical protein HJC23_010915 [Cyclotella cryptica]|uniref:CPL domain-containing protein n=1 Tax=Cyclotella cryptica TaxID=29204 RepID=A0ABD3Q9H3_9STRA|eukprot:CCRYP_007542-RA/>CCRYP_007542-RA protein AED:0.32 eAED:0.32 QI:223/1/1/1/0.5/0.33/3/1334/656
MAAKLAVDHKGKKPSNKSEGKDKNDHKKRKLSKTSFSAKDTNEVTPANKKRALKAERQSHRRHSTTVRSAKEIWNELRVKSNTAETNSKLCTELYGLLKGKMMEVAMQHDASRMVQAVLQFGNAEERLETVRELCAVPNEDKLKGSAEKSGGQSTVNLAELCKIQYAHFVVLKMIKYCAREEECVRLIVKNLKKQMTKLAVHSVGSRVVELLFATFSSKSVAPLKLELYGPQYALFASCIPSTDKDGKTNASALPTLASFVESNPDKRESTVTHLQSLIQKGLDKSLTGFSYFHSLLLDYVSVATPNDIRDFLTPALAEHCLHLISTRAGTKVVCECVAYGTVKDRKKILKCFKGYTRSSLLHRDAYLAILRMLDVMDDTVLVNKMILAELLQSPDTEKTDTGEDGSDKDKPSPILDLITSETGSKLFLLLLVSKDEMTLSEDGKRSYRWLKNFDPYEIEVLHRNPCVMENGKPVPTSKKEDETRRQELVIYLKELLVDSCVKHTEELMRSKAGSRVLLEVSEHFPSSDLFSAVVDACADSMENKGSGKADEKYLTIIEDPVGHLTLKHLLLAESKRDNDQDDAETLARMFYSKFQQSLGEIASSNRGSFVLSALIQVPSVNKDAKKALKGFKKDISKLAKSAAGAKVLLDALKDK